MGFIFTGASRVIDTPVGVSVPNFCYGACADPAFQSQEVDFVLPTALAPLLGRTGKSHVPIGKFQLKSSFSAACLPTSRTLESSCMLGCRNGATEFGRVDNLETITRSTSRTKS